MTQIFIEPELENLSEPENAAEWFEICSQLGLDKQLSTADKSAEQMAPPYMAVDPKTANIIRTLCPTVRKYKDYEHSTIPLDVLQEIQKCEKHGWYASIKIYYDDKTPDPFVVGFTKPDTEWGGAMHLIARWGAELMPFELLEEKAIARLRDRVVKATAKLVAELQHAKENTDAFIRGLLGGEDVPKMDVRIDNLRW